MAIWGEETFRQYVYESLLRIEDELNTLKVMGGLQMATVQEMNAKLDAIKVDVDEIAVDTQSLLDEIKKLQDQVAAGGVVSQSELDGLFAKASAIQTKSNAVAQAVPTPTP